MTQINLNKEVHAKAKKIQQEHSIEYPTLKNYIERAIINQVRIDTIRMKEAQQ